MWDIQSKCFALHGQAHQDWEVQYFLQLSVEMLNLVIYKSKSLASTLNPVQFIISESWIYVPALTSTCKVIMCVPREQTCTESASTKLHRFP